MTRPLLLVTNDDGITSPGLASAVAALQPLADLLVVAPARQQTSMGRAFPSLPMGGVVRPRTIQVASGDVMAWAVEASPAATVCHALLELAPRRPTLCVSGINYGENVGTTLSASGTVGAALQSDSLGVPAVAASLECPAEFHHCPHHPALDFAAAGRVLARVVRQVLRQGWPPGVAVLNLNVPSGARPDVEIRTTMQSRQSYYVALKPPERDLAQPCQLQYRVEVDEASLEPDSDVWALRIDRIASVTPLSWSMTAAAAGFTVEAPC